jgi:hypothetical protein
VEKMSWKNLEAFLSARGKLSKSRQAIKADISRLGARHSL